MTLISFMFELPIAIVGLVIVRVAIKVAKVTDQYQMILMTHVQVVLEVIIKQLISTNFQFIMKLNFYKSVNFKLIEKS